MACPLGIRRRPEILPTGILAQTAGASLKRMRAISLAPALSDRLEAPPITHRCARQDIGETQERCKARDLGLPRDEAMAQGLSAGFTLTPAPDVGGGRGAPTVRASAGSGRRASLSSLWRSDRVRLMTLLLSRYKMSNTTKMISRSPNCGTPEDLVYTEGQARLRRSTFRVCGRK